jgi:hypothetical protein
MNTKTLSFAIALSALAITVAAQAHDPKEHMKTAENPDCAAMQDMDHSKMNKDDPVTQAMMKQCMNDDHPEGHGMKHSDDDQDHKQSDSDQDQQQAESHADDTEHKR